MQIHSIVALQFLTNVTGRNFSAFRAIFLSAKRSLALLSAPFMQLRHILLAYFLPFDLGEERPRTSIIELAIRGERAHETSRRAMNNFVGAKSRLLAPPYTSFPLVLVFLHARARGSTFTIVIVGEFGLDPIRILEYRHGSFLGFWLK